MNYELKMINESGKKIHVSSQIHTIKLEDMVANYLDDLLKRYKVAPLMNVNGKEIYIDLHTGDRLHLCIERIK